MERDALRALERKVLWLAVWMIHHANHLRAKEDGLKVGGHQASSASVVTLMTALYFDVLRASDRVAVKPHASPVFHAIQYLLGRQTRDQIERFRAFGKSSDSKTPSADNCLTIGSKLRTFCASSDGRAGRSRAAEAGQSLGRHNSISGERRIPSTCASHVPGNGVECVRAFKAVVLDLGCDADPRG